MLVQHIVTDLGGTQAVFGRRQRAARQIARDIIGVYHGNA
jgi:hypothetical protein